jgi:predicted metalloprotease with PDZ domain
MTTAQPSVTYKLGMSKPSTHIFEIELNFDKLPSADKELDVKIPAWRTGRYFIFDFAGGVIEFSAHDGSKKALAWQKTDKSTWRVLTNGASAVSIRYTLYANEFNQRTRGLNDEHAFLDPAAGMMYVEKHQNLPLTLTVTPYSNWHVTTGLDAVKGKSNTFAAPNYQVLADSPIEVGNQKDFEFEAEGKKHVWMIYGEGNYDIRKIIEDTKKLVKANKEFWGELPYERFIFMLHITPSAGGGTEHLNSTIMGFQPFAFKDTNRYKGFLGLVSHEYFHTWNVKQLRPAGIHPYDFSKEAYTRELWVAEGITDYYGTLLALRAGLTTPRDVVNQLPGLIQNDRQRPGNKLQSATESSFDAWVKYWRNTQQSYNTESDYYDAGNKLGLFLDLEIRKRTNSQFSLDNVMKTMFQRFRLGTKGYKVEDILAVCEEVSNSDFKEFFKNFVYGTTPLPWEDVLAYAGLDVSPQSSNLKPSLGIRTNDVGSVARVQGVVAGSPAYEAGVDVNDDIVAMNGYRIRSADLTARIAEMNEGNEIKLTVMRDDKLREISVTLKKPEVSLYKVTKTIKPSDAQKALYEAWLITKWE